MIKKELKRLSRRELVDIIYQMKKNEQEMQEEIATLQASLQDKRIRISAAGSIAEAAAGITQVLSTAQTTADLYLNEIACMKADAEQECAKMLEDARKQVQDILAEGAQQIRNECNQAECQTLQLLREEIQRLEQKRENETCEV